MRVKRASALAFITQETKLVGINFLERSYFTVDDQLISLMLECADWMLIEEARAKFAAIAFGDPLPVIRRLVEVNGLLVEGSMEALRDRQYAAKWEWGPVAGLHHFLSRELNYLTNEEGYQWLKQRELEKAQPDQFQINDGAVTTLPYPDMESELFRTMLRRRSERKFQDVEIGDQCLSDVLFTGFGITAVVDDSELGWVPLKMAPSGGARNPFEGYVAVRKVGNVSPGIYHYDGAGKNLQLVMDELPSRAAMVGNQMWADDASAVIFLVAHFDRTMWKYPNPAAYRVVLIEAGHIVQNMMLAATHHNIVCAPTSAISDSTLCGLLPAHDPTVAVVYTLSLGLPGEGFDRFY